MGVSPSSSKKAENPSKSTADRCLAVLPERIFVRARQSPQGILGVLSRVLTQHGRKSARQNRQGFGYRQLKRRRLRFAQSQGTKLPQSQSLACNAHLSLKNLRPLPLSFCSLSRRRTKEYCRISRNDNEEKGQKIMAEAEFGCSPYA